MTESGLTRIDPGAGGGGGDSDSSRTRTIGTDDSDSFGDGSNRWIDGFVETVNNPVDRATNPVDTVTGAADAAALNFDEGVGGLVSLVDDEPGNTAGRGTGESAEDVDVALTQIGAADDATDEKSPLRSVDEAADAAADAAGDAADAAADATLVDELLGGRPVVGILVIVGALVYLNSDSELPGVSDA